MSFRESRWSEAEAVVRLFVSAFSDSEGEAEGKSIGRLARALVESSGEHAAFNFVAEFDGQVVGSIFFSRLEFENEDAVFILGPVAVHRGYQGRGIGKELIEYGLRELQGKGVEFALTYGDPMFYKKVGFCSISDEVVRPPFKLSQPEGWLGQSLGDRPVESLSGNSSCVEALCDPVYW